jgi:hypothetical protein
MAGTIGARSCGAPMTYRIRGGHQFVVIAAGQGADDALLVALSLPST